MAAFVLLFTRDVKSRDRQPSPHQLQQAVTKWQHWFAYIAAHNRLAFPVRLWDREGRVVQQGRAVCYGPYTERSEAVTGMVIITAGNYEEAITLAKHCPVLEWGGMVEIRQEMDDDPCMDNNA